MARLLKAHGLKGELSAELFTENPSAWRNMKRCLICDESGAVLFPEQNFTSRAAEKYELIKLETVNDRDAADALRGKYLGIYRKNAGCLPEGRFYVSDLIGMEVFDSENNYLGMLNKVYSNGAQDIFEISRKNKKDLLVPIHDKTFISADVKCRRIILSLPKGLMEVYEQ